MSMSMADRFAALGSGQRVQLLRRLVDAGRLGEIPAVVPPRDAGAPVRLSPAQEDLWVFDSLYPGSAALNLCCAYHFDQPVDPEQLAAALTIVVADHDVLRMRITGPVTEPRLDFAPGGTFALEYLDLRAADTSLDEALHAFSARGFDLTRQPPIRGQYIRVDDDRSTLVLALHHIATDWWSFDVLHAEFTAAYLAVRAGRRPAQGRPAVQYADFASWQRELEQAGAFEARLVFWRDYLSDLPAPLVVGGDGTAAGASDTGPGIAQLPFHVDAPTEAAVRAFARRHASTVYAVLMTAFAVLAHRLSGRDDLVLGTPSANRAARGLERAIGYVMNAVPTRWRIGSGDSFADLLARFAAELPGLLAHADVPVGRMVSAVEPERVVGRSPLFRWVFMHLPRQASVAALRQISEPQRVHTGGEHDVVGILRDTDEGIAGTLEVRTDIYPPEVAAWWADTFVALLRGLLAEPERPVAQVGLVDDAQRRWLRASSAGPRCSAAPASLDELVARHAARSPRAPAIEDATATLTYAQLDERAGRLATHLRERGVGAEKIVALAMPRSTAMVSAMLAVQRAGGAFLPLDPGHPAERLAFQLRDSKPVLLLTSAALAERVPDTGVARLLIDELDLTAGPVTGSVPGDPRRLGYVLYTSGSTGRPKPVAVTHGGIAALAEGWSRRLALDAGSRLLHHGSPSFDISVGELCLAFGAGATLVVPASGALVGDELGEVLTARGITAALLPPGVLGSVPPGDHPLLRVVCVGADVCPPDLVVGWASGTRHFHNAYGPTEATVGVTCSDPLTGAGTRVPVGRPLPGSRAYVLDRNLHQVPVGVLGELYLAGVGLARGYQDRAAATAERFVADPYAPEPGGRMYRTGDLVRWRPDGQLDFIGRADRQIKVGGVRLEPAEVEAVLTRHADVARAVVQLREDTPGLRRLVGYVVPRRDAQLAVDELVAHAAATLPPSLVPSAFVSLPRLPVTAQGKLDHDALPAPATGPAPAGRGPDGPLEHRLCALFAEVLAVPEVGITDGFFELGGDSIMAIQLASRARAAGLELSPQDVFTARSPAGLAGLAGLVRPARPVTSEPAEAEPGTCPLTPIMRWWLEQDTERDACTMSALLRTPAGLGTDRLVGALRGLIARHAVLRMRLVPADPDDWALEVAPDPVDVPAPERVDASGWTEDEIGAAARHCAAGTRLSPQHGRMLHAVWYDAGTRRPGRLLVTIHHLAVDGVSWRVLLSELGALLQDGDAAELPAATAAFTRWARAVCRYARAALEQREHWEKTVSARPGPAGATLPVPPPGARRATVTVTLGPARAEPALTRVPAAYGCGPDEVLLTALLAALLRWRGGGEALLVDLEGHGRGQLEGLDVSGTVGWFTVQYPVRLDSAAAGAPFWDGGDASGRALKQIKEQLSAVPDGGLGYGCLRHLDPDAAATLAHHTTPPVRFNNLGRFVAGAHQDAELLGATADGGLPLAHPIELDTVTEVRDGRAYLVASWSYAADLLDGATVRALADHWFDALDVLAGHAVSGAVGGATASDFPLVEISQEQIEALEDDLADTLGDA